MKKAMNRLFWVALAGLVAAPFTTNAAPDYANGVAGFCSWELIPLAFPYNNTAARTFLIYDQLYNDHDSYRIDVLCDYTSRPGEVGATEIDFVTVRATGNGGAAPEDKTSARLCFRDRSGDGLGSIRCGAPQITSSATPVDLIIKPHHQCQTGSCSNGNGHQFTAEDLVFIQVTLAKRRTDSQGGFQYGTLRSMLTYLK